MNDPSPVESRILAGRYALVEPMASGGSGVVWRAHDRRLDRTVAIKLLRTDVATPTVTSERFHIEAATAAQLNHPHAVVVHDAGSDAGVDYLVMEFVEGGTLADLLRGGSLAPGVVAGLGVQVARALGAAHARHFVHRDVKPANVLITADGIAKVADFGIAASVDDPSSGSTLPSHMIGTARYLAPEQLLDQRVDARADVYALGLVLHEALTGQVPFGEGTPTEVASRRLVGSLPAVSTWRSDVPHALDRAILRATRREPAERFADGRAFADELSRSSSADASRELAVRVAPRGGSNGGRVRRPARRGGQAAAAEIGGAPGVASTVPDDAVALDVREETAAPSLVSERQRAVLWLVLVAVLATGGGAVALGNSGVGFAPTGWWAAPPQTVGAVDEALGDVDGRSGLAEASESPPRGAAVRDPVAVVGSGVHDPFGSGEQHREDVGHVLDGDPATTWRTERYAGDPRFGGLEAGVGIWLDTGQVTEVAEIVVSLSRPGASFTLVAGGAAPQRAERPRDWGEVIAVVEGAGSSVRHVLDQPAAARVWMLWFDRLPSDAGVSEVEVSEVSLLSP